MSPVYRTHLYIDKHSERTIDVERISQYQILCNLFYNLLGHPCRGCFWWRSLYWVPGVPIHIWPITISSSIYSEHCWKGFKCNPKYILAHFLRLYLKYLLITHSCTISEYINCSSKNRLQMELKTEFKMYSTMIYPNDPLINTSDSFHDIFFVYSWII